VEKLGLVALVVYGCTAYIVNGTPRDKRGREPRVPVKYPCSVSAAYSRFAALVRFYPLLRVPLILLVLVAAISSAWIFLATTPYLEGSA
jgi:hypothetical protein